MIVLQQSSCWPISVVPVSMCLTWMIVLQWSSFSVMPVSMMREHGYDTRIYTLNVFYIYYHMYFAISFEPKDNPGKRRRRSSNYPAKGRQFHCVQFQGTVGLFEQTHFLRSFCSFLHDFALSRDQRSHRLFVVCHI